MKRPPAPFQVETQPDSPLTGLRLRTDVFYGRYETQGKLAVPHLVTLRYSDQAGYGHEITYAGVQPDPSIKESMFKRGSRLVFWK